MHQRTQQKLDPVVEGTLNLLEILSIIGFFYCVAVLLQTLRVSSAGHIAIYAGWFAASAICAYNMLHWRAWGAYCLAAATILVTIVDLLTGQGSLGGATLGMVVFVLLYLYLRPVWHHVDAKVEQTI